jgi:peptide/nickel transport system substrate-binding protein
VAGTARASARAQKIDRSAVLTYAIPLAEQGGVGFDPAQLPPNPNAAAWMNLIYDSMIRHTEDGKGAPGLAERWLTPDPQTVELTLRPGVKFSDGAPLNASAVKAAWERLLAANLPTTPADIKAATAIETVGDLTVRVRLSQPVATTWVNEYLRNSFWFAVPSPAAVAAGTLNSKPVGAGPYQLDSYVADQKITLTKNPTYYDPKAQNFARIEMIHTAYGQPQLAALQSNTANMTWNITADQIPVIEGQRGLKVFARPGVRVFNISLCATKGVFASTEARQAIQYALNRDEINETAVSGQGIPSIVPLTDASPFYNKSLQKTYKYNPKKAKALLKQAGVAPGTKVTALVSTSTPQPVIAEVVQSQLKKVGLEMEITQSTNLPGDAARLQPDMTFAGIEVNLLPFAVNQTTTLNICGWRNPEATQALTDARDGSKTTEQQQAAWDKLQRILLDESPFVFMVVSPLLAAGSDKLDGIVHMSSTYGAYLNTVYMKK